MCRKAIYLLCVLVLSALTVKAADTCQACMSNGAYCIDKYNYYLCPNGNSPITSVKRTCAEGSVCTKGSPICATAQTDDANAVCLNTVAGACSSCTSTDYALTCVSRTQYAICDGETPSDPIDCDANEVCTTDFALTNSGDLEVPKSICVPQCVMDFMGIEPSCSNTVAETTTSAPGVTPSETVANTLCSTASSSHGTATYFYIYNCEDPSCQSYIYCEKDSSGWTSLVLKCSSGFYWDLTKNTCVSTKPTCPASCA